MRTGKGDISGWLVQPASRHLWAGLVVVLGVLAAQAVREEPHGGMGDATVVRAARTWLAGGSPYDDPHFLYPPSAVLAAVPQALLPQSALRVLVPVAVTGCLVLGWACALRVHRVPLHSRFAALGLAGPAVGFACFGHLVPLGDRTVTAAVALPLCLVLANRGRWVAAGAVVGAAVALEPLPAPLLLLFVFARRWRALGVLVLVPVVTSAAAALLMSGPACLFTRALPFLLHGDDGFVRLHDASPVAVLLRPGVPQPLAGAVALVAGGAGVLCAYRRWRGTGPGPLRLAETAAGLMFSASLVFRPSYGHYLLVVLPLLLAGLPHPGSAARRPWFWLGLIPQLPGLTWPYPQSGRRRTFKDAVTLCVLAVTLGRQPVRGRAAAPPRDGGRVRTLDVGDDAAF